MSRFWVYGPNWQKNTRYPRSAYDSCRHLFLCSWCPLVIAKFVSIGSKFTFYDCLFLSDPFFGRVELQYIIAHFLIAEREAFFYNVLQSTVVLLKSSKFLTAEHVVRMFMHANELCNNTSQLLQGIPMIIILSNVSHEGFIAILKSSSFILFFLCSFLSKKNSYCASSVTDWHKYCKFFSIMIGLSTINFSLWAISFFCDPPSLTVE